MYQIQLPTSPNSEFTTSPEEAEFTIRLRLLTNGITLVSIADSNVAIADSVRAINGKWLIPYQYLEKNYGNFRFESDTEDYPYFKNFNTSCRLMYYNQEEVNALRAEED